MGLRAAPGRPLPARGARGARRARGARGRPLGRRGPGERLAGRERGANLPFSDPSDYYPKRGTLSLLRLLTKIRKFKIFTDSCKIMKKL